MPFAVDHPAGHARLRAVLRDAGYTSERIAEVAGDDLTALGHRSVPVLVHRTRGGSPLETLVRLFMAGVPVARDAAAAALAPLTVEQCAAWGLLSLDADAARAAVQIGCHGDLVVAMDWGPVTPNVGTAADYVMGFSPSTLTLARMTVRIPSRATLDLGTGSGLQALLAAPHSTKVVATDLNPRAVAVARFNAALNGVDNVECLHGDLFAPVEGRVFDEIVSNPPFVVGPRSAHMFMSGGEVDGICARIARTASRHLAPGGWCQFLANWAVVEGEDWTERLAAWFAGTGCDAWVIRRERQAADEYAALWAETEADDVNEFPAQFDRWMRFYAEHRVEAVDYGLVAMRRTDAASPRLRFEDLRGPWDGATGDDIVAAMARRDWLAATDDSALLDARLRVAPDARLTRELVAVRGEWVPVSARLHHPSSLADPGGIDPHGERVVARCDGATPLLTLLQDLAASLHTDVADVLPGALQAVRNLVDRGLLLPPA